MSNRNRNGLELEREALEWIKNNAVFGTNWELLNGKGIYDIESKFYAVDVVSTNERGYIRTEMKDLNVHLRYLKDNNFDEGIIMYKVGQGWYVTPITPYLVRKINGKRIRYEDIQNISSTAYQYFVNEPVRITINEEGTEATFMQSGKAISKEMVLTVDEVFGSHQDLLEKSDKSDGLTV